MPFKSAKNNQKVGYKPEFIPAQPFNLDEDDENMFSSPQSYKQYQHVDPNRLQEGLIMQHLVEQPPSAFCRDSHTIHTSAWKKARKVEESPKLYSPPIDAKKAKYGMVHGRVNDQQLLQKSSLKRDSATGNAQQAAQRGKLSQHQKKKLRKIRKQMLENEDGLSKQQSQGELFPKPGMISLDISDIQWRQLSISRLTRGSDDIYGNTERQILDNFL